MQVSNDNFWKSRKLFIAKIQRLQFFDLYCCCCYCCCCYGYFSCCFYISPLLMLCCFSIFALPIIDFNKKKNRNILHCWTWSSKVNSACPINKMLKLQISFLTLYSLLVHRIIYRGTENVKTAEGSTPTIQGILATDSFYALLTPKKSSERKR